MWLSACIHACMYVYYLCLYVYICMLAIKCASTKVSSFQVG